MRKKDHRVNRDRHSAMVAERKRDALDLAGAFAAQGGTVTAGLAELLEPLLEPGETLPDLGLLFELLGRLVKRSAAKLDQADLERWLAGMKMQELRSRCREARQELYDEAVRVRKALVELCGSARGRRQFGLGPRTPRGAEDLAFEVRRLVERLADPELRLPVPRLASRRPDPAAWAAVLLPRLELLEELLEARRRRRIRKSDGVLDRHRALAAHDRTYKLAARTGESLFALSGNGELARRLRPPVRKPLCRGSAPRSWRPHFAAIRAAAAALAARLRRLVLRVARYRSTA